MPEQTVYSYDFVIIGTGPAGYSAAMEAAKHGQRVAIVEKEEEIGGVCINTGTFPSKTLREAVLQLTGFYPRQIYPQAWPHQPKVSMEQLRHRLNTVRSQEHRMIRSHFRQAGVDLFYGTASFVSQNTIKVQQNIPVHLSGRYILIATGSRPRRPVEIPFDDRRVVDSRSLLDLPAIPERLIIIGGGVIGSEYATIFAALGVQVVLLDKGDRLLKFLDSEIAEYLIRHFPYSNIDYRPATGYRRITPVEGGIEVELQDGKIIYGNCLLFALGRESNTDDLNLNAVGITLNEYAYIPVNELFQTVIPRIYAVGDVIGWPSLAATSITQGRLAVLHALKKKSSHFPDQFPFGIYTIPEISYIGMTEDEARAQNMRYVIGKAFYQDLPRGQIAGDPHGMLKLVVHAETREILGVHIIGTAATEIIHTAQVALQYHSKTELFTENIFNYPTYSEAFKYAALNALNQIKQ